METPGKCRVVVGPQQPGAAMAHRVRLFSDVGAKMSMFDKRAKQHEQSQLVNPFSDWSGAGTRRKLSKDDPGYGKPVEGSKTAERGRLAQIQMIGDMVELCDMIYDCGIRSPDGRAAISFGDAFRLYSSINDKVVGLLMRGRKHKILDFEGEMLFQGRDDATMIELLLPLNTIRHKYGMPERAGCGDVREDLIKALAEQEKQQKQLRLQRRTRSMGVPEVPAPAGKHQKSHSIDDTWVVDADVRGRAEQRGRCLLQCPTPGMGRSRSANADNSFGARPRDVTPESMYSASDDEASSAPGVPPCLPEEGAGEELREGSAECADDAEKIGNDAGGGVGETTARESRNRIRLESGGDISKLSSSPCTDIMLFVPTLSANGQVLDIGNEGTSPKEGCVDENPESIDNVLSEEAKNQLNISPAVDSTDSGTR